MIVGCLVFLHFVLVSGVRVWFGLARLRVLLFCVGLL